MKKILSLALLCGLMVGFAACNKNEEPAEDTNVTIEMAAPQRVIGDAKTAVTVEIYIYKAGTTTLVKHETATFAAGAMSTTKAVRLAGGMAFDFLFYAHAATNPYTYAPATFLLSVDYTNDFNNENFDVFASRELNKTVNTLPTPYNLSTTLTRIVSQVNLLTTKADYEECTYTGAYAADASHAGEAAFYVPDGISFAMKASPSYNLKTGAYTTTADKTFTGEPLAEANAYSHPLGNTFRWLGYVYVLTPDATPNFTATIKEGATTRRTVSASSVPVTPNYRTNIYGDLLLNTTNLTITKEPTWATPDNNKTTPDITVN